MIIKYTLIIFAFVMVSCGLTQIQGCHKETEQDKVKKIIRSIQQAAEEKDIKTILNNLSNNYRDPEGNEYDTIKGILLGYFFRHQKIHVYVTNLEVTVQDSSAKAVFQAVLSGGNNSESVADILPETLSMYSFEVSLKKEPNEWLVNSARWVRSGRSDDGRNQ